MQIDDRSIQLTDRIFWAPFPIRSFKKEGDRIVVCMRDGEKGWCYNAVPLSIPDFRARGGTVLTVVGRVSSGTVLSLSTGSLGEVRLAYPTDISNPVKMVVPYEVRSVSEIAGAVAIFTVDTDTSRNLFLFERDGKLRWQLQENAFRPGHRAGYDAVAAILGDRLEIRDGWGGAGYGIISLKTGRFLEWRRPEA